MGTYYHLTPKRNVKRILREGLKINQRPSLGEQEVEDIEGRIFLGRSPEESYYNFWNTSVNNPEDMEAIRGWALLKVDLPSKWPLTRDEYGFIASESDIPPNLVSQVSTDTSRGTRRRVFKMDEEGRFQKWHEELF